MKIKKIFFLPIIVCLLASCNAPGNGESSSQTLSTEDTIKFTVNFDTKGGSQTPSQIVEKGSKVIKPSDPVKEGYDFIDWTYHGETWSFIGYSVTENMTLEAVYSNPIVYEISYNLNGGTISQSNPTQYTVEDNFILYNPLKIGYTFNGWYDNNGNKITSIHAGTTGALTLNAHWNTNLNNLSITSEDKSKGTVAITSGSGYSNEVITVVATPVDDCVFKGWYHNGTKVSDDLTYTFVMPTNDYSLVAHFFTKVEEEAPKNGSRPILSSDCMTITYGLYPQKHVNDSNLILNLNKLTKAESNGWYLYDNEYYAKVNASPCKSNYIFDNGTTIESGVMYWFKCEPIAWNIFSNINGEYYIFSSVILDAYCYNNSALPRNIGDKTIYSNNYEYSDIRSWLNNNFYNSAFALGSSHIQTTNVDNSPATTHTNDNSYACSDTQDKVFLPSFSDYINSSYGMSTPISRCCKPTDFARARGAYYNTSYSYLYNGLYWTRSPASDYQSSAYSVWYDGLFNGDFVRDYNGVRPALSIKIA